MFYLFIFLSGLCQNRTKQNAYNSEHSLNYPNISYKKERKAKTLTFSKIFKVKKYIYEHETNPFLGLSVSSIVFKLHLDIIS